MPLFNRIFALHKDQIFRPIKRLGNYLLPTQCLLCGERLEGELLCEGCLYDLPWMERHKNRCRQCALSLSSDSELCGHCLKNPPSFHATFAPFSYQAPLTPLIHRFKYRGKLHCGRLLGQLLTNYICDCAVNLPDWKGPDLLIPAPTHWTRRWQRGFNQTEILGQYLTEATGIPIATKIVERHKRVVSQKELTRGERQQNLRNAFTISTKSQAYIEGKRIALIDDVITTTATARELSELLITAGAKDVQVWALARTMDD
jgi:ComF family protein